MTEGRPKAKMLFDDLLEVVSKHDPDVLDIIEASVNLLQSAVGQFAVGQKWSKEQALEKAKALGGDIAGMVEKNWGQYPKPKPPLNS